MFSHVMVGSKDLDRSKRFYDAVLGVLGVPEGFHDRHRYFYRHRGGTFAFSLPINSQPACHANGGTIGFAADTPELVDAFHAAGLANGGTSCEDPPGWRDIPLGRYYLAYLRDPDGNKLCVLHRPSA